MTTIKKVLIQNFKCFDRVVEFDFKSNINILVGDNDMGKSTILEAIHLALTGVFSGKYISNEISQYLFNKRVVDEYLNSIASQKAIKPPSILIEIYFDESDTPYIAELEGNNNYRKESCAGIRFELAFDENKFSDEYNALLEEGEIKSLPIEYYSHSWYTFALADITPRTIPIRSNIIDSSNYKYQSGTDTNVIKIVRDGLETSELIKISQAHRKMKDSFKEDASISQINDKLKNSIKISDQKEVRLGVELSSKNAWENSLITEIDGIPFHMNGKGTQCLLKTELALLCNPVKKSNIILMEEPESHISHTNLNRLLHMLKENICDKQIIVATHSSFVANKLGLDNLILLSHNGNNIRLSDISEDTQRFFEKISGYDTLRLILCKKAILVEGDSDELVVQKAFMKHNNGKLPIEMGVDIISVGTSFLRFLEIAKLLNHNTTVVTDNDGNIEALRKKYKDYYGCDFTRICFDKNEYKGSISGFNYNTLEPNLLNANTLDILNKIFGKKYSSKEEILKYMKENKTDCAYKIFETEEEILFPQYILEAIEK